MKKRKRGERNWEDSDDAYEFHPPILDNDALEHRVPSEPGTIFYVHGRPYIKAADGKCEPLDD
jgi:hypothetical protein